MGDEDLLYKIRGADEQALPWPQTKGHHVTISARAIGKEAEPVAAKLAKVADDEPAFGAGKCRHATSVRSEGKGSKGMDGGLFRGLLMNPPFKEGSLRQSRMFAHSNYLNRACSYGQISKSE